MSKITDRIRDLLALSNSSNPHEAALAAGMARDLMERHGIEAATLSEADESPVQRRDIANDDVTGDWYHLLVSAVAKSCFCESYKNGSGLRSTAVIIGRTSDMEAAMMLTEWLRLQLRQMCAKARNVAGKTVNGRTFNNSFLRGAVGEISRRLTQKAAERTQGNVALTGTSTALTVQQAQDSAGLALYQRKSEAAIAQFKAKAGIKVYNSHSRTHVNGDAYSAGRQAGASVSMSAPSRALMGR
jgi:hypothetical protein